jgi:Flp pilus assembly protein TadD
MSLLADLLSKTKTGGSGDSKETPSPLNVPPTLSKAHGIPGKVNRFNNRYVKLGLVCVAFIAVGAFFAVKSRQMGSLIKKSTPVTVPPVPAKVDPIAPVPPIVNLTPPAATQPADPTKTARINLQEPPAATAATNKKPRPHKVPRRPPRQPVVKADAEPKAASQPQAQKTESVQQTPTKPRTKPVAPLKMDTAARDSLLYAARSAEQAGDWKSALSSYRKALEYDPNDYKILSNVAAVLNNLGMFDESVKEAERSLAKKQDYVPALINAAIGYSSKGNTPKALRLFTYASALDPGNRSLAINMGILHERSGNLDDALAAYRPLAGSGDSLVLQGLARVYERKGNKNDAIRVYRQIMALPNATEKLRKEAKSKLSRLEE